MSDDTKPCTCWASIDAVDRARCENHGGFKVTPCLVFEGGSVSVNAVGFGDRDGTGWLAFKDAELEWDDHETRFVNLPKSELEGIRDFLLKYLPPAPPSFNGERDDG